MKEAMLNSEVENKVTYHQITTAKMQSSSSESFIKTPGIHATLTETGIKINNQQDINASIDFLPLQRKGKSHFLNDLMVLCLGSDSAETQEESLRKAPSFISFSDIIWAGKADEDVPKPILESYTDGDVSICHETVEDPITVAYLRKHGNDLVPRTINIWIDDPASINTAASEHGHKADKTVKHILSKSYEDLSGLQRKYLVLINPNGGKGQAVKTFNKIIKPILEAARIDFDIQKTRYHCHCIDIAKEMDISKYDVIACCSGDGIPHEVINGLYQRKDRVEAFKKLIVTQLPCGSGNALSLTCHRTLSASHATLSMLKSPVIKMDLMSVHQGTGADSRSHLSFLSQTYGIIADADIGTEWMRKLESKRFELGVAYKVITGAKYPCELAVKYKFRNDDEVKEFFKENLTCAREEEEFTDDIFKSNLPGLDEDTPSDWETISNAETLGIFYTGKMPYIAKDVQFFPAALPNDGAMDLVVMNTKAAFLNTVQALISVGTGKQFFHKDYHYSKIEAYRLVPSNNNYISVDGENFPSEPIQGEVIPSVLNTIAHGGTFHETILHKTVI